MNVMVIDIDLGKNSCSVVGMDTGRRIVFGKQPGCIVAMEACCGPHHRGRTRSRDDVAEYVLPYVNAHKNDNRDAEAVAEAAM